MRREMITVPATLCFAAFVLQAGHPWFAFYALVVAGMDALTGRA